MCEVPDPVPLPEAGRVVGIDMGINALITTSGGKQVHNPRWYREAQVDLRRKQRKLQRAKKDSNQRVAASVVHKPPPLGVVSVIGCFRIQLTVECRIE